ncbi:Ankyrin_repeats_(many_copies)/Ankyrin_repeats_(3_copies)/Zinc_finger_-_C3HC4_type_(RING_finger)_containing_protein_-_putativ [Leishmania infantum]|uniref:Ankyrin_repeats_(Many_copies)/Ankyrin_repeats_(3_ copies)/Zinc_finger_-_C3HC4_type_(RING_finger )_containing_protein_-_putativ n=1 Tax=Leishmania infantum TaxID=5671 RepID=A0A6L0WRE3_LEIIN|nr:Ankyrin_repeats_(many_copies)/Ankyrin_repeats_(3_copies)/Zinc_finger_-_C3HC4_type_(RING_finger)_containing_protein_-_putativ [Leishmania infantum]SUZ38638.1 Ankyrin_repeats_(many_copies)/Ankyrin_repeats_(3_copies)/Zinc_finger_-_C3HC4_type_(RING_finger)_containing_protein_-_putativ [Leishmania infantum]
MEFRWAAEGKTEELRQWLREHPERVNVPSKDSNMTLLYTCISNSDRTDLASLQAGWSCYLSTVRMLCEEYKADVLAPNGGTCNTALHLAASTGAVGILRYLVEVLRTPVDCTNAFGERPVQMAERHGQTECASILAAAAATATSVQSRERAAERPMPLQQTPPGGLHDSAAAILGGGSGRFQKVTVSDSDDDEAWSKISNGGAAAALSPGESGRERPTDGTGPLSLSTQAMQRGDSSNSATAPFTPLDGRSASSVVGEARPPPYSRNPNEASAGSAPGSISVPPMRAPSDSAAFSTLPTPVRPRKEYDISSSRILANPDLQGFRFAYGDGFKYIQCSDHYEIRGILPYTYRGTVYYTPVIISVYAPTSATDSSENPTSGGPAGGSGAVDAALSNPDRPFPFMGPAGARASQGTSPAPHTTAKAYVYCRYRACINIQNLNGFAISRRAEYIDPISGAIIPAPGDDKYQTLTAYVRNVVVRNFEAVPPLILPTSSYAFPARPNVSQLGSSGSADVYHHHHSHNAPAFMKNALPKRSAAHIRCAALLRDLSRFGDGLARYVPSKHRIVAYVPIFSEHKAAVLAMPQERPYATTVGQSPQPAVANAASAAATTFSPESAAPVAGGKAGVTQQVAVEAVVELQVRVLIQFSPTRIGGAAGEGDAAKDGEACVYAQPPRIYLVDAAASPLTTLLDGATSATAGAAGAPPFSSAPSSLTAQCFAGIIKDRETGEVFAEVLRLSQDSWNASGSVYDILVELQRALRGVLESFAMSYMGRSAGSPPARQEQPSSGSLDRIAGAPRGAPVVTSTLDGFFASPMTQTQLSLSGASGDVSGAAQRSSSGYCLYCAQPLHPSRVLLQPCGHGGLCGLCVQRLQSHCREEVFACPVCRGAVQNVLEVFL